MDVDRADASAARAVAEILKSPDDMVKVAQTRKKLQREKALVEAKLKEGAKFQLDATRDALSKLKETKNHLSLVREDMVTIERACEDPRIWVEGFGKIASVSRIHRNFVSTAKMVEQLRDMYAKIDAIEQLLAIEKADALGPAPNLLSIHYNLTQLESFRNETILQAKREGNPDTLKTLNGYFERLAGVLETFESHYLHLAANLLDICRRGNSSVAVKIAKIAEVEGQRDEKAMAIRLVKRQNKDLASRFQSVQAEARIIKHYREKVMDSIKSSASTLVQKQFNQSLDNPASFFEGENFDWFYGDILVVEEHLGDKFPQDWKIYPTYIKAYHKALYEFMKNYVAGDPEAGVLLVLANFVKEYKKNMTKELDIPIELLEPALLDGKQQDLIETYLKLIVKKMDEWAQTLMKSEVDGFTKREEPPEEDADEKYGMQGSAIMFQMLNAQMDFAIESGQGAVLARVVEESARVMQETQQKWRSIVDAEFKKQMAKPDDVPGGLVEYTMAVANDLVKSADYVETLQSRLENLVSEKYRVSIVERLTTSLDGYLEVAKRCVQVLIEAVFNDLRPAIKALLGPTWYGGSEGGGDDSMKQIVETIKDYMSDFQVHLNGNLFDLLLEDMLDAFAIMYLDAIRKASKIRMPGAVEQIRDDVRQSFGFFATYKPAGDLEGYFEPLEAVVGLLSASRTMFFLDWHSFAKKYGAQLAFVEGVLKARDDLDKAAVAEMMESVRKRKDGVEEAGGGGGATIFERLGK